MVRTRPLHCRRPRFNPWSGNKDPASRTAWLKRNKKVHVLWRIRDVGEGQWRMGGWEAEGGGEGSPSGREGGVDTALMPRRCDQAELRTSLATHSGVTSAVSFKRSVLQFPGLKVEHVEAGPHTVPHGSVEKACKGPSARPVPSNTNISVIGVTLVTQPPANLMATPW